MSDSQRYIRIFLKDGFEPGKVYGADVDIVLKEVQGHTKPSTIGFEQSGKPLEGDYMEVTSNLRIQLSESRFQYLQEGQILVVVGAYDKNNLH